MSVNVKQRYKEMLEYIEFPTFLYNYETNRILGMNRLAREILGDQVRNVKDLSKNKLRIKFSKEHLENGSQKLMKQEIYNGTENIELDMEINIIKVDGKHLCIVFFQYSYKQNFGSSLEADLPRIFWKNKERNFIGMNESFKKDMNIKEKEIVIPNYYSLNRIVDTDIDMEVEDARILKGKESIYDSIRLLKTENNTSFFAKVHKIPIFNLNGTVLGILGVYNLIIDRDTYKGNYQNAIKDTYNLYKNQELQRKLLSEVLELSQLEKDLTTVLDAMFHNIVSYYKLEEIYIFKYFSKDKRVENIYASGNKKVFLYKKSYNERIKDIYKVFSREMKKEGLIAINSAKGHDKYSWILEYFNLKSILLLRFMMDNNNSLFICFGDAKEEKLWTPELIELLKDVAQIVKLTFQKYIMLQMIKDLKENLKE